MEYFGVRCHECRDIVTRHRNRFLRLVIWVNKQTNYMKSYRRVATRGKPLWSMTIKPIRTSVNNANKNNNSKIGLKRQQPLIKEVSGEISEVFKTCSLCRIINRTTGNECFKVAVVSTCYTELKRN